MDEKLDFAQYLSLLLKVREKLILHDLSNKFNLLTLALEDLEESLEEAAPENPDWKAIIREEVSSLKVAKNKYQELEGLMKVQATLGEASLQSIFNDALSALQKEVRKKNIEITSVIEDDRELLYGPIFNILSGAILLRTLISENQSFSFHLNNQTGFLKQEKSFLEQNQEKLENDFKKSYVELVSFWSEKSLF